MTDIRIDNDEVRSVLKAAAVRTERLIGSIPDPSLRTDGLDWTLGETAAHLVADIGRFGDIATGRTLPTGGIERVEQVNATHLTQVRERDPVQLAGLFAEAVHQFLCDTGEHCGDDVVAWYGGTKINVAAATCLVLGEVLVHGYDLARTIGAPWPIEPRDACRVLDGAIWSLPSMVDADASRRVHATYDVRIRGGSRVFVQFDHGSLSVEAWQGQRPDCHIVADPVALLLVGYGRKRQWESIARGKLLAWGRKPWLGPRFVALVRNP